MRLLLLLTLFSLPAILFSQTDSIKARITFTGDFRFRAEQDWDSRKTDGTYRTDRTRFRYRTRVGFLYQHSPSQSFGIRLRTGQADKQQDPQLTLGQGFKEFSVIPIGFEKLFFKYKDKGYTFWVGKNTYPFKKQNELFWSDNVYPEGLFASKKWNISSGFLDNISLNAGHFVIISNGGGLDSDSYFQGLQMHSSHWNNRVEIFPSVYLFRNIDNIPDGARTSTLDYSIFHIGSKIQLLNQPSISFEVDYYNNFEKLHANDSIPANLVDENEGYSLALGIGKLKQKGDWYFKATYAYLERYAAVDFLTQNDWARWDYSSYGSPDGRLTNLKGYEIVVAYCINPKLVLKAKYYWVEQLIPYGAFLENGQRLRLDIDIGF